MAGLHTSRHTPHTCHLCCRWHQWQQSCSSACCTPASKAHLALSSCHHALGLGCIALTRRHLKRTRVSRSSAANNFKYSPDSKHSTGTHELRKQLEQQAQPTLAAAADNRPGVVVTAAGNVATASSVGPTGSTAGGANQASRTAVIPTSTIGCEVGTWLGGTGLGCSTGSEEDAQPMSQNIEKSMCQTMVWMLCKPACHCKYTAAGYGCFEQAQQHSFERRHTLHRRSKTIALLEGLSGQQELKVHGPPPPRSV